MPSALRHAPGNPSRPRTVSHRLRAILLHIPYYSISGTNRLAHDCGVSPSTISRLLRGDVAPSERTAAAVVQALSRRAGRPLAYREVFSATGRFPTPSVCALLGCPGCLPPWAWNERTDRLRPEWRDVKSGDWSVTPPGCADQLPLPA